jgi:hypothetical protein
MTFREKTLWVAVAVGVLFGLLTSQVGSLSTISPNPFVGAVQMVLMCTILPGMFFGMVVTGNIHDFQLWVGIIANGVFYFLLCLMIGRVIGRLRMKRLTPEFEAEER